MHEHTKSSGRPAIIIFNWDDTLFCSSSLVLARAQKRGISSPASSSSSLTPSRPPVLPARLLRQMDDIVCRLVRQAEKIGRTFIVTNSTTEWVEDCARAFLPGLVSLLDKVEIVSARGCYESSFPQEQGRWKDMAFLEIARQADVGRRGDLLVIGNSELETHAADVAGDLLREWWIKVIKLRERPSVQDLMVEQRIILDHLTVFRDCEKSLTITLERGVQGTPVRPHSSSSLGSDSPSMESSNESQEDEQQEPTVAALAPRPGIVSL